MTGAAPRWVSQDVEVPERMLTLTYRVATSLGRSPRQSARLYHRVVGARTGLATERAGTDSGRRTRARVLVALEAELAPHTQRSRLDAALHDAVLLDELTLLPPRQRFTLWSAALAHDTVADIATRTGWTPAQVARLLRSALKTVTAHAQP
ncbi:hypothetical protein [Amycolatopsis sp. H20-H5]|uniref:hypothetical protein n=1 Tax=Amycolatopsis sp. H20-H5 TaxID=3046309 RepID=UPI002DBB7A4B|nr:hypothetical protein [Amycolatopsis sp. H20-H5]MEC3976404.1 hypothetical protein [Amycolatopsis sp. H20-H5]